jgi:hypothetical protein
MYANSAIAANSVFRSWLGAGFPMFASPMVCFVPLLPRNRLIAIQVSQPGRPLGDDFARLSHCGIVSRAYYLFYIRAEDTVVE